MGTRGNSQASLIQHSTSSSVRDHKAGTGTTSCAAHHSHSLQHIATRCGGQIRRYTLARSELSLPARCARLGEPGLRFLRGLVDLLEALDGVKHWLHLAYVYGGVEDLIEVELANLQARAALDDVSTLAVR